MTTDDKARPGELPGALTAPMSRNTQLLLGSRIPARLAWVAKGSIPKVVPIWFHWNGVELMIATFAGAQKLRDITSGSVVAVTIDTQEFPYRSLKISGAVKVEPVEGLADEYRLAAERYLGVDAGAAWCESLGDAQQVVLRLTPSESRSSTVDGFTPMAGSCVIHRRNCLTCQP